MKTNGSPSGVLSVLCTPFHDDGRVDLKSVRRHVEHSISAGADGVVVFGLAGEIYKLSDAEREAILVAAVEAAAGVPVIAGSEHSGIEAAVERSGRATELGASGLMLYPPTFVPPTPAEIVAYYREIGKETGLPLIVQDAPSWTRVSLPVSLLAEIVEETPCPVSVKVEAPPTAPKLRAVAAVGAPGIGGYGALHLPEEFEAGIVGCMPGSAVPKLYVEMWKTLQTDLSAGLEMHARVLPLLNFQISSLDVFVSIQKQLLHEQGVLSSAYMRRPGKQLDTNQRAWLERLVNVCGLAEWLGS
jgi:2-keto-3-deoxy-L-arabinonate dehydratase